MAPEFSSPCTLSCLFVSHADAAIWVKEQPLTAPLLIFLVGNRSGTRSRSSSSVTTRFRDAKHIAQRWGHHTARFEGILEGMVGKIFVGGLNNHAFGLRTHAFP